jgi:hypothetical protein
MPKNIFYLESAARTLVQARDDFRIPVHLRMLPKSCIRDTISGTISALRTALALAPRPMSSMVAPGSRIRLP